MRRAAHRARAARAARRALRHTRRTRGAAAGHAISHAGTTTSQMMSTEDATSSATTSGMALACAPGSRFKCCRIDSTGRLGAD
eukprot:366573-Chlamydomonas_euryale.AAC.32